MSSAKGNSGSMDAKREEFRKYLEKEGVLEYLTKQLVSLTGSGEACKSPNRIKEGFISGAYRNPWFLVFYKINILIR